MSYAFVFCYMKDSFKNHLIIFSTIMQYTLFKLDFKWCNSVVQTIMSKQV